MQKLLAEFIATFTLIFIGAGSVCANALSGGQSGLVGIALAHGAAIIVMVYATAHISGAHINPAVTFGMMLTGRIKAGTGLAYMASQLLGSLVAAGLLKSIFPEFVHAAPFLGNPELTTAIPTFGLGMGILTEFVLTFLLVFVIFGVAVDERGSKPAMGIAIGLTIMLDILVGGPLTGGAMNPARAFGTAFFTGRWAAQAVYWVGPMAGGAVAALLYEHRFLNRRA